MTMATLMKGVHMAKKFRQAGTLLVHGGRFAGRLEVTDGELRSLMRHWVDSPTEPYLYDNAATIGKGNLFVSFGLRVRRNPEHLDGFVVKENLLGLQIAWGDTAVSKELNAVMRAILGSGSCEVPVDIDYFDGGKGVIGVRRPDAVAVELGQQKACNKRATLFENTRQYRTPAEARRA